MRLLKPSKERTLGRSFSFSAGFGVSLLLWGVAARTASGQVPVAPVHFGQYAVVCQSHRAAEVGAQILARGGNAVDASVATAFALCVTYPAAGNIGGGGFSVLFLPSGADDPRITTIDFRERAPGKAHPKMFVGRDGLYDPNRHHQSHLSVGVPGTVAGLALAHSRYGSLPWKELVRPAIHLARVGFPISRALSKSLSEVAGELKPRPVAAAIFLRDGRALRPGEVLVQRELAETLERIADRGPEDFYRGRTARLLVQEMERGGGWITLADLSDYKAVEREPVSVTYRGYRVVSMAPPSSGGVVLAEMLNILEGYDLAEAGWGSAQGTHWMVEAMRRAFADQARYLGDPDLVSVPVEKLTSKNYGASLRKTISRCRASRSTPDSFTWLEEGKETTHLSVIDSEGRAVAMTLTLEQPYGARIVVPGAGFILNNEMGDFNAAPGLTTREGLIGTGPNLAAPGKRMLSSMSPTIVTKENRLVGVLGTPGGRSIINTVLEVLINWIDHRMRIQQAVDAPRFHHQWLPDVVKVERGFSPDTLRALKEMGHDMEVRKKSQGSVMALTRDPESGVLEVGCDRRRPGGAFSGK